MSKTQLSKPRVANSTSGTPETAHVSSGLLLEKATFEEHTNALQPSNSTFHPFQKLPIELRHMIWVCTLEIEPQIHGLVSRDGGLYLVASPPPTALVVCSESRELALKVLHQLPKYYRWVDNEDADKECTPELGPENVYCYTNTDSIFIGNLDNLRSLEFDLEDFPSNPWEVIQSVIVFWDNNGHFPTQRYYFKQLQAVTYAVPIRPNGKLCDRHGTRKCLPRLDFFDGKTDEVSQSLRSIIEERLEGEEPFDWDTGEDVEAHTQRQGWCAPFLRQKEIQVRFMLVRAVCQCPEKKGCGSYMWPDDGERKDQGVSWTEYELVYSGSAFQKHGNGQSRVAGDVRLDALDG